MPIHPPGEKFRGHRILSRRGGKREVVALLSLTAMVDMFTVLVIFLLQNYNVTGEVLFLPKEVVLPKAEIIKELKPAHVVTISNQEILLEKNLVASFEEVASKKDWMIQNLYVELQKAIEEKRLKAEKGVPGQLRKAVSTEGGQEAAANDWRKVTIQADKGVDFLTLKKVMYTVTEAGAAEINFAVMKRENRE